MAQIRSYRQIVTLLEDIATRHPNINHFFEGESSDFGEDTSIEYPALKVNVIPEESSMPVNDYSEYNSIIIAVNLQMLDRLMPAEENRTDTRSDMMRLLQDVINELTSHPYYQRSFMKILGDINFEKYYRISDDNNTGVGCTLQFQLPNDNSWCGLPFEDIAGFSANGPVSTGYSQSTTYLTCATVTGCTTFQDYVSIYGGGGAQNYYTTGATLVGTTAQFNRNDLTNAYQLELSGLTSGITVSGNYLPLSGGTVTGNTNFTSQLLSGGTDLYSIFSTTDKFTTGATLSGTIVSFNRNDLASAYSVELSGLTSGITFTGAYLNLSGGTVTGNTNFTTNITVTGITESGYFKVTTFNPTNPQIYCDADTNTGIMFDGPDILSLHTGGFQRLLINSSGQITNGSQLAGTGWETYLSGDTRVDLISATTLSATTAWVYNDPWTIELINSTTVDFYAPYAMSINSYTNILGSPFISLKDDGAAYTTGTTIAIGSKISVSGSTTGVTILNAIRL